MGLGVSAARLSIRCSDFAPAGRLKGRDIVLPKQDSAHDF
jgi:hypothetical protein